MLKKLLMAATGAAFITLGVGEVSYAASLNVIASGLDGPRGLTFGSDGALYVTEAGRGGRGACIPAPGTGSGLSMCYGATGAVTRIQNGKQERVVTGLPSLATFIPQIPVSFNAFGPQDIQFDATGKPYLVIGLGSSPEQRDNVLKIPDFGQLIAIDRLQTGSSRTMLADLAAYEGLYNPDDTGGSLYNPYQNGIDSNPYAFLIQGDNAYIVDAAGNDLFQAKTDGSELKLLSVFPERPVTDPATGQTIAMQSVPTSIATGPDGALYVGELTGYPNPDKAARIFRVGADNQPVVYADGFTQIVDLAFDPNGGLYVLQFASNLLNPQNGFPYGELIYVAPDGNRKTIANEGLIFPTALALGSDGNIYISNRGYFSGQGQIVKISVPEPNSTVSLLAFGVLIPTSLFLRKQKSSNSVKTCFE
ncbi:ScyD/ScyE family protein [Microseira sp. BLCC-F43]|jgi:hypothetical protein|uniref:ScyD/ScyE family protein n=1 Tax=Microseira sp. BLCC-F43 TaxID=3153602 RepID=UPI0035B6BFC9